MKKDIDFQTDALLLFTVCKIDLETLVNYIIVKMRNRNVNKIKVFGRTAIVVLTVLAMFASSVSACVCSHHEEKAEQEAFSCHQHSEESAEVRTGDSTSKTGLSENSCICVQASTKIVAKSESLKLKKHSPAILPIIPNAETVLLLSASIKFSHTDREFPPDPIDNRLSGRGPPRL